MNNYIVISKSIVREYVIKIFDNRGYWKLDVYKEKLDKMKESELMWNLQAQFFEEKKE